MKKIFIMFPILTILLCACGNAEGGDTEYMQNDWETDIEVTSQTVPSTDFLLTELTKIQNILEKQASEELYGGAYFSDNIEIIILLCNDTEENEAAIRSLIREDVGEECWAYIQFKECRYSNAYLNELRQSITAEYGSQIIRAGVSARSNCCFVVVEDHDEELEKEIAAFSGDREALMFVTEDEISDGV